MDARDLSITISAVEPKSTHKKQTITQSTHLIVAGDAPVRRHDVIVEATVLIVSDEEQGLLPLGASAQSLVHLLDQLLACLPKERIGVNFE